MKYKHMSYEQRKRIEISLSQNKSFKAIGKDVEKDCTTISKEVRTNSVTKNIGSYGRVFNNCLNRHTCIKELLCKDCPNFKTKYCRNCSQCRKVCTDFIEETCPKLDKPPYVCNGCSTKNKCTLSKKIYDAHEAQKIYEARLSESRTGINCSEEEIKHLNQLLVPLVKEQGQSIHHVYINHKDEIMHSEKTIYSFIDSGILTVRNIDLPRKVRYRSRKEHSMQYKVDKNCLEGRRFEDFLKFIEDHPEKSIVEMDSVEGKKGESCLLTIHFVLPTFMLAFKRETNDSKSVIDIFNNIFDKLGADNFKRLFPIILTDNGSEFSNPKEIEFDKDGNRRTYLFYCHPSSPFEKGGCEVNHELIRRVVPKGYSFNPYTQKDINLMMSHINSYAREKLNDKTPILLFNQLFGEEVTSFFNISYINPDDINLTSKLIS